MLAFRRALADLVWAVWITLMVVITVVLVPLALWFVPEQSNKEIERVNRHV